MNKNYTLYNSYKELKNEAINMRKTMFEPSEKKLDFIRQFARVYHFEPKLKQDLGSFIVN
jgi:hypothetical protein